MKSNALFLSLVLFLIFFVSSCKKEFNEPAAPIPPPVTGYTNIARIKAAYSIYYSAFPAPTKFYKFNTDSNLLCTVIADESSGNIYKSVYVNDGTGAIKLNLITGGGFNAGDKIRVNLNGVLLNNYGGVIQLDSIDITKKVVKIESGNSVVPIKTTMSAIINNLPQFQSQLVTLDSVEFSDGSKGQFYADAVNKESIDRAIVNYTNTTMILRTSGYASFAAAIIPCGKGKITAIVGEYNGDIQLTVAKFSDIQVSQGVCPFLIKTFDDNSLTSGGWSTVNVLGNINWTIGNFGGRQYANFTNFPSNAACESWLISPQINVSSFTNPVLTFETASNFSGPNIIVSISNNYTGNPSTATWTALSPALSGGGYLWTASGKLSLNAFKGTPLTIGYKYAATGAGKTWEIDNVTVKDDL
jgi:hypothetical protein